MVKSLCVCYINYGGKTGICGLKPESWRFKVLCRLTSPGLESLDFVIFHGNAVLSGFFLYHGTLIKLGLISSRDT